MPATPISCGAQPKVAQKKAEHMQDRRRAPRFRFVADAEVLETLSGTRQRARTGDLSMGGCFLEMLKPPPAGTDLKITISQGTVNFIALGRVVFATPNIGMGVVFTNIDPSQLEILLNWVAELKIL